MFPAIPGGPSPPAYENPPEYARETSVDNQITDCASEINNTVNGPPSPSLSEAEIAVFGIRALKFLLLAFSYIL